MTRILLILGLVVALVTPSHAVVYVSFEQITVANAAIGFTSSKITAGPNNAHPQANIASCRLETAEIRYTVDGTTPTTTVGVLLEIGDVLTITGNDLLQAFRGIRTGSTSGQLNCTYTS